VLLPYFTLGKILLDNHAYFENIYYHTKFQNPMIAQIAETKHPKSEVTSSDAM
jgi:hypothetical protein